MLQVIKNKVWDAIKKFRIVNYTAVASGTSKKNLSIYSTVYTMR